MRTVKIRKHQERLAIDALKLMRNKLNAESKYQGVTRTQRNRMRVKAMDCQILMDYLQGE